MFNLNTSNKAIKRRFICWAIVIALALIFFCRILFVGVSLDTNIMNLLPSSSQNPVAEQASTEFSKTLGQQVIFLIGSPNKELSEKAADSFYQSISNSTVFKSIRYLTDTKQQQAWAKFYFPYRLSLLSPSQQELLRKKKINTITQSALFSLYSPMSITNSQLLRNDPFFTFQNFITSLPKPATNVSLINDRLMVHFNHRWYVMVTAKLRGDSFSISSQNKAISLIKSSQTKMLVAFPTANILKTGFLFYAKSGTDMAQHDISTIGIGSIIGIILLMLLTFRSLAPIAFTLMSSVLGFVAAFVVTYWFFGSIYLFTLVFGASLIGICVDYAFFYYAEQLLGGKQWQPKQGLNNIFNAISLGLLNLVVAYIIFSFTPFPALRQLAVFAIVGLSVSYATVVCAFPYLLKSKQTSFTPPLLKLTNVYLSCWRRITPTKLVIIYLFVGVISITGILQLHANDDIRKLESMPKQLVNTSHQIQKAIGSKLGTTFFVIQGDSPQTALSNTHKITAALNDAFPKLQQAYMAIDAYIPSIASQQQNFNLIKANLLNNNLLSYLKKIGVSKQKAQSIQQQLQSIQFKPLTIQAWLHSPVSKPLRFLWLGKINQQYASIILLSSQLDVTTLQHIATQHPSATYVNKATDVGKIFKRYRQKTSGLLAIVYSILLLLLILRYKFKKGILYFLPSLSASLLSLAIMGIFAIPLTLFNVLALILVLGISMDYVFFFAETKASYQSTMLAVSLSAITTILSFGLLSLSGTPVIHYFGLTLLIGILSSFILSPSVLMINKVRK